MIELNIFDLDLNRLGQIDTYQNLKIERFYYKKSVLSLTVEGTARNIELLKHDNIITTTDNINYGYMIEHFEYDEEDASFINIIAYSMNHLLSLRVIEKQERYRGNIEDIIKKFINNNAINPANPKRVIPRLVLAENSGINISTESTATGTNLEEHVFTLCEKYEMTVDILLNHETKEFEVYTWQGVNHSAAQNENPHVIFSKDFDNILQQTYVHSISDKRTTALVAGEGEGIHRTVVTSNDEISGFNRREIYVDARDLQSTYQDENGVEVTLTQEEYFALLNERGVEDLAEYQELETFEAQVDMYSQFIYGVDYGLGDLVSVRNNDLKKILHTRVTSAALTVDENKAEDLQISFGNNIPTFLDKVRKVAKR